MPKTPPSPPNQGGDGDTHNQPPPAIITFITKVLNTPKPPRDSPKITPRPPKPSQTPRIQGEHRVTPLIALPIIFITKVLLGTPKLPLRPPQTPPKIPQPLLEGPQNLLHPPNRPLK